MEKLTTFAVNQEYGGKLRELAEKYNTSAKGFAQLMIDFFYRTGHNPENFKNEVSAEAIKQHTKSIKDLDKHIISLIKKQDKEILLPMASRVEAVQQVLADSMNGSVTQQLLTNQQKLTEKFRTVYPNLSKEYENLKTPTGTGGKLMAQKIVNEQRKLNQMLGEAYPVLKEES